MTLASDWFQANGMTTNPSKRLSTWFGTDTNDLSNSLNDTVIDIAYTMQLLGVSIDKDLNFNVHVKKTVRKVCGKLQVLKRYKHLIPTHAKKRLYLAYFLPHLIYYSTVWFHCGKRNADLIVKLNESILCFLFNDFNNSYEKLLQEINQPSLRARRIHNMLILAYRFFWSFYRAPNQHQFTSQTRSNYSTCKYNKLWSSFISISCQQTMEHIAG